MTPLHRSRDARASRDPRAARRNDRRTARLVAVGLAFLSALATGAIPIIAGGAPVRPELVLAGGALVVLGVGVIGWAPGVTVAAIALAGEYAVRLPNHSGIDAVAILEAVALFATVELALRALESRSLARPEPPVRVAAAVSLVAMLSGAAACAAFVLALGSRELPAPTAGLVFGLAAAVAILGAADALRRRAAR